MYIRQRVFENLNADHPFTFTFTSLTLHYKLIAMLHRIVEFQFIPRGLYYDQSKKI